MTSCGKPCYLIREAPPVRKGNGRCCACLGPVKSSDTPTRCMPQRTPLLGFQMEEKDHNYHPVWLIDTQAWSCETEQALGNV